jgi:hypothetical protein
MITPPTKDTVIGSYENPGELDIFQTRDSSGALIASMNYEGVLNVPASQDAIYNITPSNVASIGNQTAYTPFNDANGNPITVAIPAGVNVDGKIYRVRLSGQVTSPTLNDILIAIFVGPGPITQSGPNENQYEMGFVDLQPISGHAITGHGAVEIYVQWSSGANQVEGWYHGWAGGGFDAPHALVSYGYPYPNPTTQPMLFMAAGHWDSAYVPGDLFNIIEFSIVED